VTRLTRNNAFVVVTYPWNDRDGHTYTGVPPYVSMMQELELLQNNQMNLIDNFIARVKQGLEEYGMNSEQITVDALRRLLDELRDQISSQLQNFNVGGGGNALAGPADQVEIGTGYILHFYSGMMKRIPEDWWFPRCGVFDLWWQWWIGDQVCQVPPLRNISVLDVNHLDGIPLTEEEMHGRTGGRREQR